MKVLRFVGGPLVPWCVGSHRRRRPHKRPEATPLTHCQSQSVKPLSAHASVHTQPVRNIGGLWIVDCRRHDIARMAVGGRRSAVGDGARAKVYD